MSRIVLLDMSKGHNVWIIEVVFFFLNKTKHNTLSVSLVKEELWDGI